MYRSPRGAQGIRGASARWQPQPVLVLRLIGQIAMCCTYSVPGCCHGDEAAAGSVTALPLRGVSGRGAIPDSACAAGMLHNSGKRCIVSISQQSSNNPNSLCSTCQRCWNPAAASSVCAEACRKGTSMKGSVMRKSYAHCRKLDSMSPAVTPLAATKAAVPPLLPARTPCFTMCTDAIGVGPDPEVGAQRSRGSHHQHVHRRDGD